MTKRELAISALIAAALLSFAVDTATVNLAHAATIYDQPDSSTFLQAGTNGIGQYGYILLQGSLGTYQPAMVATSSTPFGGTITSIELTMQDARTGALAGQSSPNVIVATYTDSACTAGAVDTTVFLGALLQPSATNFQINVSGLGIDLTSAECVELVNAGDGYGLSQAGAGFYGNSLGQEFGYIETDGTQYPLPPIDWSAVTTPPPFTLGTTSTAIAASSSLWGSLTIASSSISCDSGNLFSDGLCSAAAFLFVPSPTTISQFLSLPSVLQTKVPFSWFYAMQMTYSSLSASSTSNMADVVIPFASLGIGSTTAMGDILPNVTVLSSTTITTYLSPAILGTLLFLETCAIWVLFAYFIYGDITKRNRLLKQ